MMVEILKHLLVIFCEVSINTLCWWFCEVLCAAIYAVLHLFSRNQGFRGVWRRVHSRGGRSLELRRVVSMASVDKKKCLCSYALRTKASTRSRYIAHVYNVTVAKRQCWCMSLGVWRRKETLWSYYTARTTLWKEMLIYRKPLMFVRTQTLTLKWRILL